jgi:hypothetical protein
MKSTLRSSPLLVMSLLTVVAMSCSPDEPEDAGAGAGTGGADGGRAEPSDSSTAGVEATEYGGSGSLSPSGGGAQGGMSQGGTAAAISGAAGAGGSEAKTCADLEACCSMLSGNDQKTCLGNLATGNRTGDFLCDFYYEFFEFAGKCP